MRQMSKTTAAIENTNATTPTPIPAFAPALRLCGSSSSKNGGPDPDANGGRPPAVRNGGGPENGGPSVEVCVGRIDVRRVDELTVGLLVNMVFDANVACANEFVDIIVAVSKVGANSVLGIASLIGVAVVKAGSNVVAAGSNVVVIPGSVVTPRSTVVVSAMRLARNE